MRRFSIVCVLTALAATCFDQTAQAQITTFPYQAQVETDELFVRSGPGKKYYPTGKLTRGTQVVVHRHDPGGWFMIAPPTGSFSWIAADAVRPLGGGRGLVTSPEASVRVGSAFADTHDIEQSRLSMNAEVQILEEKMLQTDMGLVRMFKIAPPRDEYRWIEGKFVTPVDPQVRQQNDRDPFAFPTQAKRPEPMPAAKPAEPSMKSASVPQPVENESTEPAPSDDAFAAGPAGHSPGSTAAIQRGPTPEELQVDRSRLDALDAALRRMAEDEMANWDFTQLEQQFRELGAQTMDTVVGRLVQTRLQAIEHYRGIKAEYDSFVQLTSETSQRDAQLAAMQQAVLTTAAPQPKRPTPTLAEPAHQPPVVSEPSIAGEPLTPIRQAPAAAADDQPDQATGPAIAGPVLMAPEEPIATTNETPNAVDQDGFLPPIVVEPPFEDATFAPATPGRGSPVSAQPASVISAPAMNALSPAGSPESPALTPVPANNLPIAAPAAATPAARFDGAGMIQRAPVNRPGFPTHVLTAPDGRILAWLQPVPGINLDRHVGQSMGVIGPRGPNAELQADVITVHDLLPVRLAR